MAEIEDNIRYGEAVQEMMGKNPAWIVRAGSVIAFVWLVSLFALAIWIRYPETLAGVVSITSDTPPVELVARESGRIDLLVANNERVRKDQVIATINSSASYQELVELSRVMKLFQQLASNPALIQVRIDSIPKLANLGKVQNAYNTFINTIYKYQITYALNKNSVLIARNLEQVATLKGEEKLLREKASELQQELASVEDNYKNDQSLFEKNLISKADYDLSKSKYWQVKINFQNNAQAIIENKQDLQRLNYSVNELSLNDTDQKKSLNLDIMNSYNILASEYRAYKEEFFIVSPVDGVVSFFEYWNNNQYVTRGDRVAYVVMESHDILGKLIVKDTKFGKVKIGQKVRIKLNSYSVSEYGMLMGKVSGISKVSRNNAYRVDVDLDSNLITTYKKKILFNSEMRGIGEIVTEDVSLLERIFYTIRAIGKKEFVDQGETELTPAIKGKDKV